MKEWESSVGIILQEVPNIEQLRKDEEERLKNADYASRIKSISHRKGDEITVKFKIEDAFKSNFFYGLMFGQDKEVAREILGADMCAIGWNTFDSDQVVERLEEMIAMTGQTNSPEVRGVNRMLGDLMYAIRNGQLQDCSLLEEEK